MQVNGMCDTVGVGTVSNREGSKAILGCKGIRDIIVGGDDIKSGRRRGDNKGIWDA